MEFRCPICGKVYKDAMAMAKCATDCAIRIQKEEEAKKKNKEAIKALDEKICKTFTELKGLVNEYNVLNDKEKYKIELTTTNKKVEPVYPWGKPISFKRMSDLNFDKFDSNLEKKEQLDFHNLIDELMEEYFRKGE